MSSYLYLPTVIFPSIPSNRYLLTEIIPTVPKYKKICLQISSYWYLPINTTFILPASFYYCTTIFVLIYSNRHHCNKYLPTDIFLTDTFQQIFSCHHITHLYSYWYIIFQPTSSYRYLATTDTSYVPTDILLLISSYYIDIFLFVLISSYLYWYLPIDIYILIKVSHPLVPRPATTAQARTGSSSAPRRTPRPALHTEGPGT